jgi:hypothetical protein
LNSVILLKRIFLALVKGSSAKSSSSFAKEDCAGYQKAATGRDLRSGTQEKSVVVAFLQKLPMFGHQLGKLLERDEILSLQKKMLHDAGTSSKRPNPGSAAGRKPVPARTLTDRFVRAPRYSTRGTSYHVNKLCAHFVYPQLIMPLETTP